MSLPLMFYERDIITKKKPFVPPSVPSTNKKILHESSENTFRGRIVVNGEEAVKVVAEVAKAPEPVRTRIVVNGEKSVEQKLSSEPVAEKPKPRRRKVVN